MPEANYRALCANLLWAIQIYTGQNPSASEMSSIEITEKLMDAMAAAAALAQPEPAPTDEDLEDLAEVMNVSGNPVPAMRRALELWGRQ